MRVRAWRRQKEAWPWGGSGWGRTSAAGRGNGRGRAGWGTRPSLTVRKTRLDHGVGRRASPFRCRAEAVAWAAWVDLAESFSASSDVAPDVAVVEADFRSQSRAVAGRAAAVSAGAAVDGRAAAAGR